MSARSVEVELVRYRTADMIYSTGQLVHNFAQYTDLEGTATWPRALATVARKIQQELPTPFRWQTKGISIEFSGFRNPMPIIGDRGVIFKAREPNFIFIEDGLSEEVRPTLLTRVGQALEDIVQEMHDVYRLDIDRNPLRLIFPKAEYAKSIEVFNAAMLDRF